MGHDDTGVVDAVAAAIASLVVKSAHDGGHRCVGTVSPAAAAASGRSVPREGATERFTTSVVAHGRRLLKRSQLSRERTELEVH